MNPEFDSYIENAPEFAKPILEKVRKVAHKACPGIQEVMKWRHPHFELDGLVAGVSAHKKHVTLGFWKGGLLDDPDGVLDPIGKTAMTGMKLEKAGDVPSQKILVAFFKQAAELNRNRVKSPPKKKAKKRPAPKPPADLLAALKKRRSALATFEGFSPSNQREYIEWVTEAKRAATREKRIVQAVEWMAEGKPRNWKYMNC